MIVFFFKQQVPLPIESAQDLWVLLMCMRWSHCLTEIKKLLPIEGYIKCTTTRTLHLENLSYHSTYMEIRNTLSQCPLWNIWHNLNKKVTCLGVFMQPSSEISCHDVFVFHRPKFLDGNFKKPWVIKTPYFKSIMWIN